MNNSNSSPNIIDFIKIITSLNCGQLPKNNNIYRIDLIMYGGGYNYNYTITLEEESEYDPEYLEKLKNTLKKEDGEGLDSKYIKQISNNDSEYVELIKLLLKALIKYCTITKPKFEEKSDLNKYIYIEEYNACYARCMTECLHKYNIIDEEGYFLRYVIELQISYECIPIHHSHKCGADIVYDIDNSNLIIRLLETELISNYDLSICYNNSPYFEENNSYHATQLKKDKINLEYLNVLDYLKQHDDLYFNEENKDYFKSRILKAQENQPEVKKKLMSIFNEFKILTEIDVTNPPSDIVEMINKFLSGCYDSDSSLSDSSDEEFNDEIICEESYFSE